MKVGILDYGMGNIKSLSNALSYLNIENNFISDFNQIELCDTLILPGVGAFGAAMNNLATHSFISPIKDHLAKNKKLIGICLGMQLLFEESYEFGINKGLGFIKGKVLPFKNIIDIRVPHVGWNKALSSNPKYSNNQKDYYFLHSYYCKPNNKKDILFTSSYGINFCSGIKSNNIYGLQFHPEKSQKDGLNLLKKIINE